MAWHADSRSAVPAPYGPRVTQPRGADAEMTQLLRNRTAMLTAATVRRLDAEVAWYRDLAADDRSWISLVATSGITAFIDWYERPTPTTYNAAEIFRAAPPELTRSISLQNALALVRIVVEVVEENTQEIASPPRAQELREAVLIYSREVAFSAAEVYARAAEARGAWDARMEALAVDALLRDDSESLASRVATLGWSGEGPVLAVVGTTATPVTDARTADLRRLARRAARDALVGNQGERVIVVLGGFTDPRAAVELLLPRLSSGPVVMGPVVPDVAAAGRSARAALSGLAAVRGWPDAPRPVTADELLPERALAGDASARASILARIVEPLEHANGPLLETLAAYLESGRSLEAAARGLYVHPNTVRYRLRRITEVTGWDPTHGREGFVLHVALIVGRLAA